MTSKLKNRLAGAAIGALVASLAVVGVIAMPATAQQATGGPVASASQGLIQHIQRAFRIGRVANQRSVQAIRIARAAHGQAGQPGPQGPAGPRGPQGPAGSSGSDGATGPTGPTGATGPTGTEGADGNSVLNGPGAPSDQFDGVDGDFYIDTGTNEIYGPKTAGEWGAPTDLQGSPWTAGGTLPSSGTLTGVLMDESPGDGVGMMGDGTDTGVLKSDFNLPLNSIPTRNIVPPNPDSSWGSTADCPGVVPDDPFPSTGIAQATPGHLCIYLGELDFGGFAVPPMTPGQDRHFVTQQGFAEVFECESPNVGICTAAALWAVTGTD